MPPSRTLRTKKNIFTIIQNSDTTSMRITIRFVNFMNYFFHLHCREVDRTQIHFVPCTFRTFKKEVFTILCHTQRIYVLIRPLTYVCFFYGMSNHVNYNQFILGYILITREFITISSQGRPVIQRIYHPKISKQTFIFAY